MSERSASTSLLRRRTAMGAGILLGTAFLTSAYPAHALQPLGDFVAGARSRAPENREAAALTDQRRAEAQAAWSRLGPALTARASYTRNQYAVEFQFPLGGGPPQNITITPQNQLDAFFTVDQPLVDVQSWMHIGAAEATADAAKAHAEATTTDVERSVSRSYFDVIAGEAVLASAQRALAAAVSNEAVVAQRHEVGTSSDLDADRARAEVERAKQSVTEAETLRAISARTLESLSGVAPALGGTPPQDDLHPEPPLESLLGRGAATPNVIAAGLDARAAARSADAARAALAPVVAASATEHMTNATSFSGDNASWTASVTATWRIDGPTVFGIRAADEARAGAVARRDRTVRDARDAVFVAWQTVRSAIDKGRAARVEAATSAHAAEVAHLRYASGAATQLEVIQAERDAFAADVARIRADAELGYARVALRLATRTGGGTP